MPTRIPDVVVFTRDLAIAHAVSLAAPEGWTEWHQTFSSALLAIQPGTSVLVFDGDIDGPLSRLLPTIFVDQRAGRRAIVLQSEGSGGPASFDPRLIVLPWPQSLEALSEAISDETGPRTQHDAEQVAAA